tara:strand:+ start:74 stop:325 length:252 start_codon:yes stop_codon:yes gene_type:complete
MIKIEITDSDNNYIGSFKLNAKPTDLVWFDSCRISPHQDAVAPWDDDYDDDRIMSDGLASTISTKDEDGMEVVKIQTYITLNN